MNLLEEIRSKAGSFSGTRHLGGIEAIINHIDVAEKHLSKGRNGEDYLFSDVIYRTNQAFEGALKEAYEVLAGKSSEGLTSYKIEKYFSDSNILRTRVLDLFTNYRTEWRNKSTHDHTLFFTGQEAFLAIVTISAFVSILLDQMSEKVAYDQERKALEAEESRIIGNAGDYSRLGLLDKCVKLFLGFSEELQTGIGQNATQQLTEVELTGRLLGYLSVADPSIRVTSEVPISIGSRTLQIDMLLERNDEKVVVELKRQTGTEYMRRVREGLEQLYSYLVASNLSRGILFCPPTAPSFDVETKTHTRNVGSQDFEVTAIYPKRKGLITGSS